MLKTAYLDRLAAADHRTFYFFKLDQPFKSYENLKLGKYVDFLENHCKKNIKELGFKNRTKIE